MISKKVQSNKKEYCRVFEVFNYMLRAEIAAWGNTLWNQKVHGFGSRGFIFISTNNKIEAYINAKDLSKAADVGYKNLIRASFVKKDFKLTWQSIDKMYKEIDLLNKVNLEKLSQARLGQLAKKYFNTLIGVYGRFQTSVGWYTVKVEEDIRNYLIQKIPDSLKREDVLRNLVRPTKRFAFEEEEINWLTIVLKAKEQPGSLKTKIKSKNANQIEALLQNHYLKLYQKILKHQQTYEWLNADSNLISFTLRDCFQKLQSMIVLNKSQVNKKLKELINRQRKVVSENAKLIKKYKINNHYQRLFKTLQEYAYTRFCIRICWTHGMYYGQKIYKETSKRAKVSPQLIRYCLSTELIDYLLNNKPLKIKDLKLRKKQYVIWMKNFKLELYTGQKARKIVQYVRSCVRKKRTNEVRGDIGSPGKVVGKVKVISYAKPLLPQIKAMKKGDILVAGQTRPEIIVACQKASAIVTNEGGICSHAAVVSRELKIPSIIGTKIATDIFKDGDKVEVDAFSGIVKKI